MLSVEEYERAMQRIEQLMSLDPPPNSDAGNELIGLVDQALEYELHFYPMLGPPTEARA